MTGIEMNCLIAEKIMGYSFWLERRGEYSLAVWSKDEPWMGFRYKAREKEKLRYRKVDHATACAAGFFVDPPRCSTDIAQAWKVLEEVAKRFRRFEVHAVEGGYVALVEGGTSELDEHYIASSEAPAAPLAICVAALRAVGVEVPE